MSARKKTPSAKAVKHSFIFMILKAIGGTKSGPKGASRQAIANYIIANFGKTAGGHFNASLRNAIKKGLESGALRQGDTAQRFKLGEKAKSITNPPKKKKKKKAKKKVTKKKKKKKSKKKTTKKKKKKVSKKKKKKKVTKKKKKVTKKKKKTTKKKKKVTKKKVAKKSKKKTTKKKRKSPKKSKK